MGASRGSAAAALQVSLMNYPAVVQHAPALRYPGHSSHVTGVRWARDESYAISVGGRDRWAEAGRGQGGRELCKAECCLALYRALYSLA